MKKLLKISFATVCAIGILFFGAFTYAMAVTTGYNLDDKKLNYAVSKIEYLDFNGQQITTSKSNNSKAIISALPNYVKNAFIAIEDKRFYKHNGIDIKGLTRAFIKNAKSATFKEGGSTISQQLIKNTHLSGEKTVKRKLAEIKLTLQLEKRYDKNQILEMYLNSIYFGENAFGITNASALYFDKSPNNLTLNEAAVLACVINAPSIYSPFKNPQKCLERRNLVLKLMQQQNFITEQEYFNAVKEPISVSQTTKNNVSDFYVKQVNKEFDEISALSPYDLTNCKIYTYYEPEKQETLSKNDVKAGISYNAITLNKNGTIAAYYGNTADEKRQTGSALKPVCVYAPSIEENLISELTPILDEKTDFNGYSPSNYGDKYYGYVNATESLEKSSNVCAVKLINSLTPVKAIKYLNKLGIEANKDDENLSLALGSTKYGVTLKSLANAYLPFINDGLFTECKFISKITLNEKTIYENKATVNRVFSEDTSQMINHMCECVVKNGTAKKLGALNAHLAGKTGTVGNKNGNTDAYCISYSPNYILGIRLSGELDNGVTGGGLPTNYAYAYWKKHYDDTDFDYSKLEKIKVDAVTYNQEHALTLADDNAPDRYVLDGYFRKNNLPKAKSTRFTNPKIETPILLVNKNEICIQLCHAEYIDFLIYRKKTNGYELVFDSKNSSNKDAFSEVITNYFGEITYKIIPYSEKDGIKNFGKEVILAPIKITNVALDEWWNE